MSEGRVEAVYIGAEESGPLGEVPEAVVVEGKGLQGDRYEDTGDITLIEAEALEELEQEHGIQLPAAESRRQVLTRGVRLNPLVGKRFRVGGVECIGAELCEPCSHLQNLTQPGVLRGLVHRGGLRADIISGGVIRPGDAVAEVPDSAAAPAP